MISVKEEVNERPGNTTRKKLTNIDIISLLPYLQIEIGSINIEV